MELVFSSSDLSKIDLLLSTGNKLSCDCRLTWLHKLRNETKSKRTKASLNRLVCIMDTNIKPNTIGIKVVTKTEPPQKISPVMFKNNYDDNDEDFDEDRNYDDTMQDQVTELESKIEYRRKLMEIPTEMLPCPNRLSYEASYSPPTQDEVKYYKTSSSKSLRSISWIPLLGIAFVL